MAQALTLSSAHNAAIAIAMHAAKNPDRFQYEIRAAFSCPDRAVEGFQARVMDLDGFGAGYLNAVGEVAA